VGEQLKTWEEILNSDWLEIWLDQGDFYEYFVKWMDDF
jgi:hypothetical protein